MEAVINSGLTIDETRAWLALLKCPRFGVVSFQKLNQSLQNPLQVFSLSVDELHEIGLSNPQIKYFLAPDWQQVDTQLAIMESERIYLIPYTNDYYPQLLQQTARPAIAFFVQGDINLLNQSQIAFVGSRNPSTYGLQVTKYLIEGLVSSQTVITSGMAIGIDGAAHQAALESGIPTIAVMGAGHQHIYPKRHQYLASQIKEQGLLLTEFFPDVPPVQHNFPRRNRIIAGMATGVVMVEASIKSGSLITTQYAVDEGREVFTVPGNIFNPLSQGAHHLIQQGAKLVTCAADIVEEYGLQNLQVDTKNHLAESRLLASVDYDITSVDRIAQRTGIPIQQVLTELLDLEIQGRVIAAPGGYIKVANP